MSEDQKESIDIYADEILSDPLLNELGEPINAPEKLNSSESLDDLVLDREACKDAEEEAQAERDRISEERRKAAEQKSAAASSPPIINDPTDVLDISIQQGQPLQRSMTDPVRNDQLVASVRREESTTTIFNGILQEIAEELAYLKAFRREQFLGDHDTSDISFKRVKALREMVETLVKREQQKGKQEGKIDFYGERFEKVMTYFLETVSNAFEKSGVPDQFHDIFFAQLGQDLEGFEKKVEKIYYGKR
jgi:hypothetical protein